MPEPEFIEVGFSPDLPLAQMVVDEVLKPEGIVGVIHDRASVMIPAPATMTGGFYIAVPKEKALDAIAALKTALSAGVVPDSLEVATLEDAPR
jgi:uncharacterized membrane protein